MSSERWAPVISAAQAPPTIRPICSDVHPQASRLAVDPPSGCRANPSGTRTKVSLQVGLESAEIRLFRLTDAVGVGKEEILHGHAGTVFGVAFVAGPDYE